MQAQRYRQPPLGRWQPPPKCIIALCGMCTFVHCLSTFSTCLYSRPAVLCRQMDMNEHLHSAQLSCRSAEMGRAHSGPVPYVSMKRQFDGMSTDEPTTSMNFTNRPSQEEYSSVQRTSHGAALDHSIPMEAGDTAQPKAAPQLL